MERTYFAKSCVAVGRYGADRVVQSLKSAIQRRKLGILIPVIKLERNARGQFYVALGVDADGEMPGAVGDVFQDAHISGPPLQLKHDDLGKMFQGEIATNLVDGFRVLERGTPRDLPDPSFTDPETVDVQFSTDDSDRAERLLNWMSANGDGSWEAFSEACHALGLSSESRGQKATHLRRRLVMLGHVEFSDDGRYWSTCESVLIGLPTRENKFFFAGARTESIIEALRTFGECESNFQPGNLAPARVLFDGQRVSQMAIENQQAFHNLGIRFLHGAGKQLALHLPKVEAFRNNLTEVWGFSRATYDFQFLLDGNFVDPPDPYCATEGDYSGRSGLYRVTAKDSQKHPSYLYLDKRNERPRWCRGALFDLQFLAARDALTAQGENLVVKWDPSKSALFIPIAQRWPNLYERALVLSSGFLPRLSSDGNWLQYLEVTSDLAHELAGKLDITLLEHSCTT